MLMIKNEIQKVLFSHAEAQYPAECCGILLGKQKGAKRIAYRVIPTENMGDEKQRAAHFVISPLEILKSESVAEREGLELIGFYHSHPNCEAFPSSEDALYMIAGYSYPIISVRNGVCASITCFEKDSQESMELKEEKIVVQGET